MKEKLCILVYIFVFLANFDTLLADENQKDVAQDILIKTEQGSTNQSDQNKQAKDSQIELTDEYKTCFDNLENKLRRSFFGGGIWSDQAIELRKCMELAYKRIEYAEKSSLDVYTDKLDEFDSQILRLDTRIREAEQEYEECKRKVEEKELEISNVNHDKSSSNDQLKKLFDERNELVYKMNQKAEEHYAFCQSYDETIENRNKFIVSNEEKRQELNRRAQQVSDSTTEKKMNSARQRAILIEQRTK